MTSPQTESFEALIAQLADASLRNYSVEELAGLLRCRPRYIEDNLKTLPCHRFGRSVSFDAEQVRQIKEMHRVNPLDAEKPEEPAEPKTPDTAPVLALAHIRPAEGRRKRTG